jgi:hypothetical protein
VLLTIIISKLMGIESNDIDIALDNMTGEDFII